MLALHILAGLLGIASGGAALMVTKGARLHVQVGLVFVSTMLVAVVYWFVRVPWTPRFRHYRLQRPMSATSRAAAVTE